MTYSAAELLDRQMRREHTRFKEALKEISKYAECECFGKQYFCPRCIVDRALEGVSEPQCPSRPEGMTHQFECRDCGEGLPYEK